MATVAELDKPKSKKAALSGAAFLFWDAKSADVDSGRLQSERICGWIWFSLLCLVASTRWALSEVDPHAASTLPSLCIGLLGATLFVAALVSAPLIGRAATGRRLLDPCRVSAPFQHSISPELLRSVCGGGLLVAGTALLPVLAHPFHPGDTAIALALTPVVVTVAEAAVSPVDTGSLPGRLWPGLAAAAGLLLLLPAPALDGTGLWLLGAMPLLTGVGAILLTSRSATRPVVVVAALSGGSSVVACAWTVRHFLARSEPSFFCTAAALDGTTLLLSFLAFTALQATRWSAQFALVPLLIVGEGFVLLRPSLDLRSGGAMVLLLIASVVLLRPPE